MSKDGKILVLIMIAVAINRACSLLPAHLYFDPFPFYDMMRYDDCTKTWENVGINLQAYCYAITVHGSFILVLYSFRLAIPKMTSLFSTLILIEYFSLADFFIIYEQSWFKLGTYPVEFTDFKIILYATSILLWKSGKL